MHRLRLTWDFLTESAIFAIDPNYAGGEFVPDLVSPVIHGADNGFTGANAHVVFGASGGTSFDNFSVTALPEPGTILSGLAAIGLVCAARRRKQKTAIAA